MIGILASRPDEASMNIARELIAMETDERIEDPLAERYHLEGAELIVVDELHLDLEDVGALFEGNPRWIAIVSKHAGETGKLLTAHFPGNIGEAEFGGRPRTVPPACPNALQAYLKAIDERAPPSFEVGIECTHHGPTDSSVPLMFVEIGSDVEQWQDREAARAVASAVRAVRNEPASRDGQLVGLGGDHYAPRFERVLRETDWAVGHIAPDWALGQIARDQLRPVLAMLFEASDAEYCLIDGENSGFVELVEDLGARAVSERWLRATSKIGENVLDSLESTLSPLDGGLILGDQRVSHPDEFSIVTLPRGLFTECASIDLEGTIDAVERTTVAYVTTEDSARPSGELAVPTDRPIDELLDELTMILSNKYDTVQRTDDGIVASRRSFDPAAAAAKGVPEGPLFGQLAAGESVTIEGREIDPAEVTEERTVTYGLPPDV